MKTETQLDLFKDQSKGRKRGKYATKDRRGKRWNNNQIARLKRMVKQGMTYREIADALGRTHGSVTMKVYEIRQAKQEQHDTPKTIVKSDYPQEPRVRISDVHPVPTPLSETTVTNLVKRFDLDRDVLHKCVNKLANRVNAADNALGEQEVFNHNQRITNRLYAIMHGVTLFVVVLIAVQVFS